MSMKVYEFPYSALREVHMSLEDVGLRLGRFNPCGTQIVESVVGAGSVMVGVIKARTQGCVIHLKEEYCRSFTMVCGIVTEQKF